MIIEWKTSEYEVRDKGRAWYVSLAVLGSALLAYSVYAKVWTMTALVALLTVVYVTAHRKKPREINIKISENGVTFGKKEFHYEQLRNFWYSRLEHLIAINTRSKVVPQMTIHLEDQDVPQVISLLASRLEQTKEPDPSLFDNLCRTIGI